MRTKKKASAEKLKEVKKNLKEVEKADVIQRSEIIHEALEYLTIQEASEVSGKSALFIGQYSKLYWFPLAIKELIKTKQIGMVDAINIVTSYDAYDPKKYQKALTDIKKAVEEKEKARAAKASKRGRKKENLKEADLKRTYKSLSWMSDHLSTIDKKNVVQQRVQEVIGIAMEGGKKQDVLNKLEELTAQTAGRK
jgi:uncharacterized protein Veg